MRGKWISTVAMALAITAWLALAAPAGATTIAHTHITAPAKNPTYLTYNYNTGNSFKVAGTTDSTAPTTDTVDILCFYGDYGQYLTVQDGVTLSSNKTFSVPKAPLSAVADHRCRLAAVPSGTTTLGPGYRGPWINVSQRKTYSVSGGPNDGMPYDLYAFGQQTAVADDYDSIGTCGLCDSYLQDVAGGVTSIVFYANSFLWYGNEEQNGNTRSEIQVNGRNAYVPAAAQALFTNSDDNPGFPAFSWHFSQNSLTGDVTITETDGIARCTGSSSSSSYPPTATSCPKFKSTGVEVDRKIVQSASGHVVSITDTYKSTDGHSHRLDLLYENAQCLGNNGCLAGSVGYRFPGKPAYNSHAPGDVVNVRAGIGSIYVRSRSAPDGDPYAGQGAITYGRAPDEVLFIQGFNTGFGPVSDFTAHYVGKVPAKGSLTYRFVYSTAYTYAQVHQEALAAQRALKKGGPVVAPADAQAEQLPGSTPAEVPARTAALKHGRF
ncbi:MAG TPA: hypothetical protein VFB39_03315 [Solirubrobacteraceae bacterium]|nr:hypothetical protein [Solirubrobacteraceae bacterium]